MSALPTVPIFYKGVFTLFDLVLPLGGVFLNVFQSSTVLEGFSPSFVPPRPETRVLLDATAGWCAMLAFIHVAALRARPHDIKLWQTVVGGLVLQDLFQILGFTRAMHMEGRLFGTWIGGDYGNVVGYGVLALIRIAFTFGVGLAKPKNQ